MMRQIIQNYRTGELAVRQTPAPTLRSGGVLVATRASLVSAGTEKMLMDLAKASLAGKALARPDLVRQVIDKAKREGVLATFEKVMTRLDTPIPLGYSCAGRVIEAGHDAGDLQVGARVACAGAGYANHAEYNYVLKNLCVKIPDGVDDEDASFVTLGAIALQGVRQAAPTLGERVAVLGLGLLGLLTVQLLKANGCRVLGYDPIPAKGTLARQLGADMACHEALPEVAQGFSDGYGVDAVIITASTRSDEPVNTAAAISRQKGRVVLVGMVGMKLDRDAFYQKELDLRLSMSYGPGRYDPSYEERGHDYPFAYVRWTERRNMQAFLELVREGRVTPKALVTHRFPIDKADEAYALMEGAEPYLGIVINYPEDRASPPLRRVAVHHGSARPAPAKGRIGFIGAGNFARSVLLPTLKKVAGDVEFTGVATMTSISAAETARKFGFRYATTDYREVLADPGTDTVFIVTRHNLHAPLVCEALGAGKHVFVEKPLAINHEQLEQVVACAKAHPELVLMVGFNRRFAPIISEVKNALEGRQEPLVMLYRINAGAVDENSWLVGPEGAGRIIGEVCHFIDTLSFLADARPTGSNVMHVDGWPDAVSLQLRFSDGSIGTIVYSSLGDSFFPKEYIEVLTSKKVIVVNDYCDGQVSYNGKVRRIGSHQQNKGINQEISAFLSVIHGEGHKSLPTLDELVATTSASFTYLYPVSQRTS